MKAILLAGLQPNLALNHSGRRTWRTNNIGTTVLPINSAMAQARFDKGEHYIATFTGLAKGSDGKSTFLNDPTIIDPLSVALFASNLEQKKDVGPVLSVNGWLPLYCRSRNPASVNLIGAFWDALSRMQNGAFADLATGKPMHDNVARDLIVEAVAYLLHPTIQSSDKVPTSILEDLRLRSSNRYNSRQLGRSSGTEKNGEITGDSIDIPVGRLAVPHEIGGPRTDSPDRGEVLEGTTGHKTDIPGEAPAVQQGIAGPAIGFPGRGGAPEGIPRHGINILG